MKHIRVSKNEGLSSWVTNKACCIIYNSLYSQNDLKNILYKFKYIIFEFISTIFFSCFKNIYVYYINMYIYDKIY